MQVLAGSRRILCTLVVGVGLLTLIAAPSGAQENSCRGGNRVAPVTRFGNPISTFSSESAATMADLQRLFVRYEQDLRTVLELAHWGGDADDLFAAVASGNGVSERAVAPLTELDWMGYRKNGQAACVNNVLWKGKDPFPAWNIVVVSEGNQYNFVVPKACLNLSIETGTTRLMPMERAPAPEVVVPPEPPARVEEPEVVPIETPPEPPVVSERDDRGPRKGDWIFRIFGARADTSGNMDEEIFGGPGIDETRIKRSVGSGSGFGLGLERLLTDRLGLAFGLMTLDLDGSVIVDIGEDWTMTNPDVGYDAFDLGLNFHLLQGGPVDLFIGPFVSLVDLGGSDLTAGGFDNDVGFGAKLGADFPFGSQSDWALTTGVRFLSLGAESNTLDFDLDPLIGLLGLSYKF